MLCGLSRWPPCRGWGNIVGMNDPAARAQSTRAKPSESQLCRLSPSYKLFELLLIPGEERCFGFFGGHGAVFEAEFFEVVPGFADVGSGG